MPQDISFDAEHAHFDQITELEGTKYLLQFRYNQRADRYAMNVLLEDGTPLVHGLRLCPSRDLLGHVYYKPEHPGGIVAVLVRSGQDDGMPGFGEIGSDGQRTKLLYFSVADMKEALA